MNLESGILELQGVKGVSKKFGQFGQILSHPKHSGTFEPNSFQVSKYYTEYSDFSIHKHPGVKEVKKEKKVVEIWANFVSQMTFYLLAQIINEYILGFENWDIFNPALSDWKSLDMLPNNDLMNFQRMCEF